VAEPSKLSINLQTPVRNTQVAQEHGFLTT
jgi:hypothetical protein